MKNRINNTALYVGAIAEKIAYRMGIKILIERKGDYSHISVKESSLLFLFYINLSKYFSTGAVFFISDDTEINVRHDCIILFGDYSPKVEKYKKEISNKKGYSKNFFITNEILLREASIHGIPLSINDLVSNQRHVEPRLMEQFFLEKKSLCEIKKMIIKNPLYRFPNEKYLYLDTLLKAYGFVFSSDFSLCANSDGPNRASKPFVFLNSVTMRKAYKIYSDFFDLEKLNKNSFIVVCRVPIEKISEILAHRYSVKQKKELKYSFDSDAMILRTYSTRASKIMAYIDEIALLFPEIEFSQNKNEISMRVKS